MWLRERHGANFEPLIEEATKIEASQLKGKSAGKLFESTDLLQIAGGEDQPKVRGRTTRVSARTVRSLLTYRPILSVPGIEDKPVFFFHGTGDELVSYEHTNAMFAAARTKKSKLLIEGGSHGMILDEPVRKKILSTYLGGLERGHLLERVT
jgi:pimeloyl-ACP methyl ester carboxylesterase